MRLVVSPNDALDVAATTVVAIESWTTDAVYLAVFVLEIRGDRIDQAIRFSTRAYQTLVI